MKSNKLLECINNQTDNYIFPFFWQHGEDDATLIREINAIYESGIKALCVEARPFEQFCEEPWWHTMGLILKHCKKLGMKVWLLDDKHFPSGYANGLVSKKYPDERMWGITETHIDVKGPMQDAAAIATWEEKENDVLLGVVAYKRLPHSDTLTGEPLVLTENVADGMVYFDVPEGCWRVFFIYKTQSGYSDSWLQYADKLTEKGGDIFIEAVYEPHYQHFSEYFGNTFVGFFSDEPCFGNNTSKDFRPELGRKYSHFPYTEEVFEIMQEKYGDCTFAMLPGLWFETDDSRFSQIRLAYMDAITLLYRKYFSYKLGDWCRAHGVEYIGHIIEDDHQHIGTGSSCGHFYRALDGQDMAGIDVVLLQIMPGFEDYTNTVPCSYDIADADFFHFMLPKLGTSHAHIQAEKKGRCMCEIYGAYGWAEGLKMMKWLTDFMLVRGVNQFVPHAFSPKFPDDDCPPHFYAGGTNPQYKDFRLLMEYMNRVCHILNDGRQVVSAGLLYYAEAAWAGGKYMRTDVPARYLTENQLDYDIIPIDYLKKAELKDGKLHIGNSICPCLILPYAEYQPEELLCLTEKFAGLGLPVYILSAKPCVAETHAEWALPDGVKIISLNELEAEIRNLGFCDVTLSDEARGLRFCHINHGNADYYFITNETTDETVENKLNFKVFKGGKYIQYNAMTNRAVAKTSTDGKIKIKLAPYESLILVFGENAEGIPEFKETALAESCVIENNWNIYTAEQEVYLQFTLYKENSALFNITGRDAKPKFAGHIRYEKDIEIKEIQPDETAILDLGFVGEIATLYMNDGKVGTVIAPPYRFDISDFVKTGTNKITLDVTTHYGYRMRDWFSQHQLLEPSGLMGPVKLEIYKNVTKN